MKKRFSLFLVAVLSIFALVACSNQTQGDKAKGTEQQKELTALEVLAKSSEAMKALKGYKIEGTGKQHIEVAGQKLENNMTFKGKFSNNPAAMHMEMTMDLGGMNMKTEIYADQQNMYISDVMNNKWTKLPAAAAGQEMNDPTAELQQYKALLEQLGADKDKALQMKKENGQYVVTLNIAAIADRKEVKDVIGKIAQGMAGSDPELANVFNNLSSNLKIEKLQYVYYIDEKTFELKKQESELKMQLGVDQQQVVTEQKTSTTVTKSDEVVTIPEEVKQKAQ